MLYSKINTFDSMIPYPTNLKIFKGSFFLDRGIRVETSDALFQAAKKRLEKIADFLKIPISESGRKIIFQQDESAGKNYWKISVSPDEIILKASDQAGSTYAVSALAQMLSVATMAGPGRFASLNCGEAEDYPRFAWRGFMLDSARHFTTPDQIKQLLYKLAFYRFNVFHWHLTDNESWRVPSALHPQLNENYELEKGFYSKQDLKEICELAAELNIRVVPEIDWPGHSRLLARVVPVFRCEGNEPGDELCVGSELAREKAAELLAEFMDLFPESTEIHLGGDEADSGHWEKCPVCQKALKQKNLPDVRALEHDFMLDMIDRVRSAGKKTILWCDAGVYPQDVIMQLWCSKGRQAALDNGNPVIDSNCGIYYCNRRLGHVYPEFDDHQEVTLVEDTYRYEPLAGFPQYQDQLLGVEACLWTGYIPARFIMSRVMPRLPAISATAWGKPQHKNWLGYCGRWARLDGSGIEDIW